MSAPPHKDHLVLRRGIAFALEVALLKLTVFPVVAVLFADVQPWTLAEIPVYGALEFDPLHPCVFAGFFVLRDSLFGGTSPGKRLLGLRVVRTGTEERPSLVRSVLRNILLSIAQFVWLLELVVAHKTADKRRIGDRIAGTQVVDLAPHKANHAWGVWFVVIVLSTNLATNLAVPEIAKQLVPLIRVEDARSSSES